MSDILSRNVPMIDVPSAVAAGGGDNHLRFEPGEGRMEDSFSSDEQEALFEAVGCERNEEWKVATQVRKLWFLGAGTLVGTFV